MATSLLITGGAGFLGSAIVNAVQERHPEWAVTVLDLTLPHVQIPNINYRSGDVTDATSVNSIVHDLKPDVIIHSAGLVPELAFRYGREQQDRVFNINVNGTRNMLAAAKFSGVKALAAAESLVLRACDKTLATCALRPSVVFGPGDYQLIPSVHACIAKGETPFVVGDGENLWDVTYVSNVADAHVLAVENLLSTRTAAGEAIFISNEEPIPFRDFCLEVWKNFGHYPPYEVHIPLFLASFIGYIAEAVTWIAGTPATLSRGSVLDACGTRYCSGEKARKILGYKPRVGIEEGIRISCIVSFRYVLYRTALEQTNLTDLEKEYAQRLKKSGSKRTPSSQ